MIRRPINPLNLPVDPMGSPRSPTLTLGPPGRPSWALTPLDPLAYLYCLTNHQRTVRHFAYSCHFIYGLRSFFCIFPLCHFTFIFGHWSILCILWFCFSMSSSLFVISFSYSVVGLFPRRVNHPARAPGGREGNPCGFYLMSFSLLCFFCLKE